MNPPQKEKKVFDLWRYLRRMKYRVTNFFQYRLMASSKHMLIVGNQDHALVPTIYKEFGVNWRIAHMGYFGSNDPTSAELQINLNNHI